MQFWLTRALNWSILGLSLSGLVLACNTGYSQPQPLDSVILQEIIINYSIDRTSNIFLALKGGQIIKYSSHLDSLVAFSSIRAENPDLLEGWHSQKVFCFYQKSQQYLFLDRKLSRPAKYSFPSSQSFIEIATVSSDENLWLIDASSLSLIKYNLKQHLIEINTPLEFIINAPEHELVFMREYQNLLFIVDSQSGIYIFDNVGNYVKRIQCTGINNISFAGDTMLYFSSGKLYASHIYSKDESPVILDPLRHYKGVVATKKSIYLISNHFVHRYAFDDLVK